MRSRLRVSLRGTGLVPWLALLLLLSSVSCLYYRYGISTWVPAPRPPGGKDAQPVAVGFVSRQAEPDDETVNRMVDEVIEQVLGKDGLRSIVKRGDKVVIKVNLAGGPSHGAFGQKGRGTITDPRIVRHVADRVREIIGWEEPASVLVVDALFHPSPDPSLREGHLPPSRNSFHLARLERTGDNSVDPADFCYDYDADGILDGASGARLVNLDSIGMERRFLTVVQEQSLGETPVYLPNLLRTKEQAHGDEEYCDVLIGLPILKSHLVAGLTGAIKLHYGFRPQHAHGQEAGRWSHGGFNKTGNVNLLADYLAAQHKVRTYDFVLMDAITGNRRGPHNLRYEQGFDTPTDYILMNAMIASRDPVALDTVAALLAGYKPESIEVIKNPCIDGLGVCWPEWIRVAGWDGFTTHRQHLLAKYDPKVVTSSSEADRGWTGRDINLWMPPGDIGVFGSYPFAEWGSARRMADSEFRPGATALLALDGSSSAGRRPRFAYSVSGVDGTTPAIARIDFLVNDQPVDFRIRPKKDGAWDLDLSSVPGKTARCRIAVWDDRLNCTLSEEVELPLH